MAWISTTNVNAARDRNSYCAPSLCCLDQTGHSEGGQKREWKIETARLRGFGYPEFYFSSMRKKKRIPTTTDKRRGYGHGARARASKKGDEGGKGEEKKKKKKIERGVDGREAFQNWPIFRVVRRWYPRLVQRINVLGSGLSAAIFYPRLRGGSIGMNEWTCALLSGYRQHQVPN